MNRVVAVSKRAQIYGEKLLIPYFMAGHPDLDTTVKLIKEAEKAGADMVEIGVPFSDPVADGPIIEKAGSKALEQNVNLVEIIKVIGEIRGEISIPIILMTYYNPIYVMGKKSFVAEATKAGIHGVIIPDLPMGYDEEFNNLCRQYELCWVPLATPTTTDERMKLIAAEGEGFVYCISATGTTGIREDIDDYLQEFLIKVRKYIDRPLAVGFGISNEQIAKTVSKSSDGVIVGSAIVDLIEQNSTNSNVLLQKVGEKINGLKRAISADGHRGDEI
ncbi:tryptophan synthase alpha chain [Desulfitispora alkaliphila]|uniref:tryptophan synthase subunit alpha n=1 Tax=Desulfitispora alkaliphila TaxID=622674 RepID=UPI003D19B584